MNYQWYPGHMMKAKRMMQENIKLIDLVIELVDARIPLSSRNPDIDALVENKFRIILLNKADLADPRYNKEWTEYFKAKGFRVVEINSRSGAGVKSIQGVVQETCREKTERDRKRGIVNRPVRAMVVGIPNVGKSTFINSFAGKACTKTGNKPGVTKGKQWIRMNKGLELLDTPGILWPKFEDQEIGLRLAMIGSINDDILSMEELSLELIDYLQENYRGLLEARYGGAGSAKAGEEGEREAQEGRDGGSMEGGCRGSVENAGQESAEGVSRESVENAGNLSRENAGREGAGSLSRENAGCEGAEGVGCENAGCEGVESGSAEADGVGNAMGTGSGAVETLYRIGRNRHCFSKGKELDLRKAAGIVIDDFRSGKLGRITLEFPDDR